MIDNEILQKFNEIFPPGMTHSETIQKLKTLKDDPNYADYVTIPLGDILVLYCEDYSKYSDKRYTSSMTEKKIREKFHKDGILDKAYSNARKNAGGEATFVKSGISNVIESTMEEVYLMGWRDAMAQMQSDSFPPRAVSRDRITKTLKEGEIDREAIENAKDIMKLDISVLGGQRGFISSCRKQGYRR